MTSIYEAHGAAAIDAALLKPIIETRIAVNVRPGNQTLRFIKDTMSQTLGGNKWEPVAWAEFNGISLGQGLVPDTAQITLDGRSFIDPASETPDTVLQNVLNETLRDRPIQIGIMVLDPDTKDALGLKPEFVGTIDNAKFDRPDGEAGKVLIDCTSIRGFAARRTARIYSETDHLTRFPGDDALKHISKISFFKGYSWNKLGASAPGGGTGGGGLFEAPNFNHR